MPPIFVVIPRAGASRPVLPTRTPPFGADFADERLIGTPAVLSLNTGKFQLPLAQNRVALQKTAGANSKLDKTWGQGQSPSPTLPKYLR
ncbi:hypothetical protein BCL32_1182 [Rhizobium mongolense USDA 1844]|uniref:Uncharacterized protein n=1 Tax=Rhizobium mongolense USDA 1844 TaxID=1079460 RepID=A0A559TEE8_9HYPH|nr:hypothetical protein BCL32_1182 [Rhizobium mongolense USDA 1844]